MPNLFVDCDGVLANFDKRAFQILGMTAHDYEKQFGSDRLWSRLAEVSHFFLDLELMPDAFELYNDVRHFHPIILSGSPSQLGEAAKADKYRWIWSKFGVNQRAIICQSKKKSVYCLPGDILIDDTPTYREYWENAGGIWIHHENAKNSLKELSKYVSMNYLQP